MRSWSPLLLAALLACAEDTPSTDDTGPDKVYDPNPSLVVGGDRPTDVLLPAGYDVNERYPLVVLLHGYGASGLLQDAIFALNLKVDSEGFILIRPDGTMDPGGRRFWNATNECCDLYGSGVDDVAYVGGILDEALDRYAIDPERVALVGHSNGAYMAYRMACDRSDVVRRIVGLAGGVSMNEAACPPGDPVAVTHIHGTADDVVPYAPNSSPAQGLRTVGARAAAERWAARNGCDATPGVDGMADHLSDRPGDETTLESWAGCADGAPVRLWSSDGGDHYYYRGTDTFRNSILDAAIAP